MGLVLLWVIFWATAAFQILRLRYPALSVGRTQRPSSWEGWEEKWGNLSCFSGFYLHSLSLFFWARESLSISFTYFLFPSFPTSSLNNFFPASLPITPRSMKYLFTVIPGARKKISFSP